MFKTSRRKEQKMELKKQIEFKMMSNDSIAFFMTDCATDEKLVMLKNSLWLDIDVTDNPNDIIYAMYGNLLDKPIYIYYISSGCYDYLNEMIDNGDILNDEQAKHLSNLLKTCVLDDVIDYSIYIYRLISC